MERIARATASLALQEGKERRIVVGRDARESSPVIRDIAVNTLVECGFEVVDLGVVVTPLFYFAARTLKIEAGLMITASHNPPEYNGFKVFLGETTIHGDKIQELRRIAEEDRPVPADEKGRVINHDIFPDYLAFMKEHIKLGPKKLKVVVDCGNGTAGLFAPRLFRELSCEVVELYCNLDPRFPNHHPDPVKVENCQDLIAAVKREGADLGMGFDGDGDRLGVVDRNGRIIWGDMLMILYWREILPRYPGTTCIVEVKCSKALIDEIEKLGGKPMIYKTGHSLIKAKMKEIGAVFTGEMSGHLFFADEYFGFDDALYAGARLLRILTNSQEDLSDMLASVPQYYATPEIRVKSTDEEKFAIVEEARKHFASQYEVIDIDGVRVLFPDGWGLIRASNTGPELILRCEGCTPEALEKISKEVFSFVENKGLKVGVIAEPKAGCN